VQAENAYFKRIDRDFKLYELIVSAVSEPMAVIDKCYNYIMVNGRYEDFWGKDKDGIVGKQVSEVIGRDLFEGMVKDRIDRCLSGENVCYSTWFQSPTYGARYLKINYHPYRNDRCEIIGMINIAYDFTEQMAHENSLRESEERFRILVEASPMSILLLQDGKYVFGNKASADLMGYACGEDVIGLDALAPVAPEFHGTIRQRIERLCKGESNPPAVMRLIRPDGNSVWTLSASALIWLHGKPTVVVVSQDITEQKKIEMNLNASQDKFKKIFESTPALMSITDIEDGRFYDINEAFINKTGYARAETIGRTSVEIGFIAESERSLLKNAIMEKGSLRDFELKLNCRDGSRIVCSYSGEVIELAGRKRLLSFAIDITERKRQEGLVREKQLELEAHSKKLEEMNTALNVLIDHRSQEKESMKREIATNFEKLVFPYLRFPSEKKSKAELCTILSIVERNIREILLNSHNLDLPLIAGLTPTESKIAHMIRDGQSSKEIAASLNMSVRTVYFHRENIRKKLNLTNNGTSLKSRLQSQRQ